MWQTLILPPLRGHLIPTHDDGEESKGGRCVSDEHRSVERPQYVILTQCAAQCGRYVDACLTAVLETVKAAQLQNGLRHRDFQRYRQYCARRLRRIRKSVKFMHGKGKQFINKKVNAETATENRLLYLPLYNAERAWGYAMQLKEDDNLAPCVSCRHCCCCRRCLCALLWVGELSAGVCVFLVVCAEVLADIC